MLQSHVKPIGKLIRILIAGGVLWSMLGMPASAEELSKQQIFDALTGGRSGTRGLSVDAPATRGLSVNQPATRNQSQEDQAFIESLRGHGDRSLSLGDREKAAATVARTRRTIDLEIYFDYNSARVSAQAVPQLTALGETLADPELRDAVILIGGHTDAKGGDAYNQELSERRAEAVKRFLVRSFRLTAANLVTAGYGKQHPRNTADPFAAENRRVQIGNMSAQARQ